VFDSINGLDWGGGGVNVELFIINIDEVFSQDNFSLSQSLINIENQISVSLHSLDYDESKISFKAQRASHKQNRYIAFLKLRPEKIERKSDKKIFHCKSQFISTALK
jgi:hypothetical protein